MHITEFRCIHRLTQQLRLAGTSRGQPIQPPLLRQCQLEQGAQDHVHLGFEYLHRWRHHSLSQQLVTALDRLHSTKRVFLHSNRISCISVCAYCCLSCHCIPLRRDWLPPTRYLYIYMYFFNTLYLIEK